MNGDAARRYKDVAGLNTQAVERMREADRGRQDELGQRVLAAERALAEVSEQERVARVTVESHWETAMRELWNETWLKALGPMPPPAKPTPGLDPKQCDAEVGRTYEELFESLRKPSKLPRFGR